MVPRFETTWAAVYGRFTLAKRGLFMIDTAYYCCSLITVKGLTWNHRSTSATSTWKAARSACVILVWGDDSGWQEQEMDRR